MSTSISGPGVQASLLNNNSHSDLHDISTRSSLELQTLPHTGQPVLTKFPPADASEALHAAMQARKIADEALKTVVLLKVDCERGKLLLEKQKNKLEARENEQRLYWFPWLAIALAANLMLWLSMLYTVFVIDMYSEHRAYFIATTWIIFVIPFLILGGLVFTPYPRVWRHKVVEASKKRPSLRYSRFINLLNAITCFTLVLLYLYASALPVHNTPKWSSGVSYANDIQFPGIVLNYRTKYLNNPSAMELGEIFCAVRSSDELGNDDTVLCNDFFHQVNYTSLLDTGPSWLFNASAAPVNVSTPSSRSEELEFTYNVGFDSTVVNASAADNEILIFYVFFFDPRLDFDESRQCDLSTATAIKILSTNSFTLTAMLTTDTLGLIKAPALKAANQSSCADFYRKAFALDPPYTSYAQITSTGGGYVLSDCDTASGPSNKCSQTISFQFGSLAASTLESVPGIEQLDIWLNAGAIVGAVQFFAWFLGIFNT